MYSILSESSIKLNSEWYLPGQTVSGQVMLNLKKDLSARCLKIKLRGREQVPGVKNCAIKVHVSEELDAWKSDEPVTKIPAGAHTFPFHFKLPDWLPPTFKGNRGKIKYYVKVRIERKKLNTNLYLEKKFLVKQEDGGGISPREKQYVMEKGYIKLETSLPTDLKIDQKFEITAQITNNWTHLAVQKTCLSLIRKATYHCCEGPCIQKIARQSGSNCKTKEVVVIDCRKSTNFLVEKLSQATWKTDLAVPTGIPPSFETSMTTNKYYYQFEVYMSRLSIFPVIFKIPVELWEAPPPKDLEELSNFGLGRSNSTGDCGEDLINFD